MSLKREKHMAVVTGLNSILSVDFLIV